MRSKTVILFFCILFLSAGSGPNGTHAGNNGAALYFSVPPAVTHEGDTFTVDVKVSSPGEPVNAVSGKINFSSGRLRAIALSHSGSIVKLWTQEPVIRGNRIVFEGVILNPGFQGTGGLVLRITFEATKAGVGLLNWDEGSVLANDGLGTNVLAVLNPTNFSISAAGANLVGQPPGNTVSSGAILPIITKYSFAVEPKEVLYIKGKGEPNALTKLTFEDISIKSLGERFIEFLQHKKQRLGDVVIQNDKNGSFYYINSSDLVAGVYNATPFLVEPEKNTETPGLPIQLLVHDSELVKDMVILLNVMGLLIPIMLFGVIIFFIPWYSWKKMRLMKEKMIIEEEKLHNS